MMEVNMNLTFPIADWLFGTSDLDRGLIGTLLNGYDTRFLKKTLRAGRGFRTKRRRRGRRQLISSYRNASCPTMSKPFCRALCWPRRVLAYWSGSPVRHDFDLYHGRRGVDGRGDVGVSRGRRQTGRGEAGRLGGFGVQASAALPSRPFRCLSSPPASDADQAVKLFAVPLQRFARAVMDNPAAIHHHDARRNIEREFGILLDQDQRQPFGFGEATHRPRHLFDHHRRQSLRGLVHQDHGRIADERARIASICCSPPESWPPPFAAVPSAWETA